MPSDDSPIAEYWSLSLMLSRHLSFFNCTTLWFSLGVITLYKSQLRTVASQLTASGWERLNAELRFINNIALIIWHIISLKKNCNV